MRFSALFACVVATLIARDAGSEPTPSEALLVKINEARKTARQCGTTQFAAAPPLQSNKAVIAVASSQARFMASTGSPTHSVPGGSAKDRLAAKGYSAAHAIDLIAADSGSATAAATVDNWLASPVHCSVVMDPQFKHLGVGYAENASSPTVMKHFWTALFAKPAK